MATEQEWYRLNVDWHESTWLAAIPWQARSVWTVVLGHVKRNGRSGTCKAPIVERFAAGYDIPIDCVTALLDAANAEGALLIEDGQWTVRNWDAYQKPDPTNKKRQQEWRERNAANKQDNGNVTPLPCHATSTPTPTSTDSSSKEASKKEEREVVAPAPSAQRPDGLSPVWDELGKHPDPMVKALAKAAYSVKAFRGHAPSKAETIARVIEVERAKAPSDAEIADEIRTWLIYWGEQENPRRAQWWRTFHAWCAKRYGAWALTKERASRPAKSQQRPNTTETVADQTSRILKNLGIEEGRDAA